MMSIRYDTILGGQLNQNFLLKELLLEELEGDHRLWKRIRSLDIRNLTSVPRNIIKNFGWI